jgi:restriction system protein
MLKFILKSAIWAVEASYNTPERKGARGERLVHNALTSVLDEQEYRVLTDLILPVADGTTQIDHLVLSRFGIFVIETKNMSGWIFGGADQQKWTQVQKRSKRRFQNPLRQNYAHVKAVQEILKVDQNALHNFVVFTGTAKPKTAIPDSVAWGLEDLGKLIALQRKQIFTEVEVHTYLEKLRDQALENTKAMRNQHLQNLENKVAAKKQTPIQKPAVNLDQTACPKCGKEMLKRTNGKTGDAFWGCASFPKCRGTRKVAYR